MPISGQNIMFPPFFAGDGKDGSLFGLGQGFIYNATKMYESVYFNGESLDANGHRIFVKGLLRIGSGGTIKANGLPAADYVGGAGSLSGELGGGGDGGTADGNGSSDSGGGHAAYTLASLGGNGGGTNGGAAFFSEYLGNQEIWLKNFQAMYSGLFHYLTASVTYPVIIGGGGGGQEGGAVDYTTTTAGGGGGGGGVVWIAADTIWIENGGLITANGGAGSPASSSGAAQADGGSGGGAGAVVLFCNHFLREGTGAIHAIGGTYGTGVNGGANGSPGANGNIVVFTPKEIITATGTLSS